MIAIADERISTHTHAPLGRPAGANRTSQMVRIHHDPDRAHGQSHLGIGTLVVPASSVAVDGLEELLWEQ